MNTTCCLAHILKEFGISEFATVQKIDAGNMNTTYLVHVDNQPSFILQQVNGNVNPAIFDTWDMMSSFRYEHDLPIAEAKRKADEAYILHNENSKWRMQHYIENHKVPINVASVRSAASLLSDFHKKLSVLEYKPDGLIFDGFHDGKYIAQNLYDAVRSSESNTEVSLLADTILNRLESFEIPKHKKQLIHGDPKWNNILFDENGNAHTLVDLDTIMIGDVLIDIGDALRSWMSYYKSGNFDKEIFNAGLDAYNAVAEVKVPAPKVLLSAKAISYQLAARYLTDYFNPKSFLKWDKKYPSLKAQHLARAKKNLDLGEQMVL